MVATLIHIAQVIACIGLACSFGVLVLAVMVSNRGLDMVSQSHPGLARRARQPAKPLSGGGRG
jgi:hypothetical protein